MLQELLPLRLKVTGHVFVSAVNLSEHLITGQTAAEWKRLSPSLSFFSSPPPVTAATSSEPERSAGPVIRSRNLCVYLAAGRAGMSSVSGQTGSTTCQSIVRKKINRSSYSKRPFISSSGEELQPGPRSVTLPLSLSRCILGKLTDKRELSVGRVGRGPVLRMSGGGLFYSRWTNREIWEGCAWFLFALASPPSSTSQRCASFFLSTFLPFFF